MVLMDIVLDIEWPKDGVDALGSSLTRATIRTSVGGRRRGPWDTVGFWLEKQFFPVSLSGSPIGVE